MQGPQHMTRGPRSDCVTENLCIERSIASFTGPKPKVSLTKESTTSLSADSRVWASSTFTIYDGMRQQGPNRGGASGPLFGRAIITLVCPLMAANDSKTQKDRERYLEPDSGPSILMYVAPIFLTSDTTCAGSKSLWLIPKVLQQNSGTCNQ